MTTQDIAKQVEHLRAEAVLYEQAGCPYVVRNLREAASALEHLAGEVERLRPPHTPEGLHWLGDIGKETHGCVAYFKDEAACLAFMKWLGERDDEVCSALGDTPAGLDRQGPRDSAG